jgi:hypothetical protein
MSVLYRAFWRRDHVGTVKDERRRSRLVVAAVWLLLGFVLALSVLMTLHNGMPEVAKAHRFVAEPQVTIHRIGKKFYGRIKTKRGKCRRHRRVTLIKARRGISDVILARDRTNRKGRWKIKRRRRPQGRFYAVISKRVRSNYGHFHKCRRDRSRTLRVPS